MVATIESPIDVEQTNQLDIAKGHKPPVVLFVDDDPHLISAMQRSFRPYRVQLEVAFHGMQGVVSRGGNQARRHCHRSSDAICKWRRTSGVLIKTSSHRGSSNCDCHRSTRSYLDSEVSAIGRALRSSKATTLRRPTVRTKVVDHHRVAFSALAAGKSLARRTGSYSAFQSTTNSNRRTENERRCVYGVHGAR